jgi:hypothetical protein
VDAWLDAGMHDEPKAVDPRRFRRRLPLELTPDELALLEHHQARHGSKRATLVAGLYALQAEPDRDQLAQAARDRDTATAEAAALRKRVSELEAAAKRATAKASRSDTAATDAKGAAAKDAAALRKQLAKAGRDLTQARSELAESEEAYAELDEQRIDGLRCPRCEEWAEPDEWATRETDDGYLLIYHQPCGFHEKSFTSPPTIMAYRRGD